MAGCDERTPEPKPRWNPKPEQIQILESIFNSGMINPPRDEIKKIRARLQEYGQVGDANVFYWFQNRKSRSKNKTRRLQKSQSRQAQPVSPTATKAATTSSSSYSDNSSSNSTEFLLHSYLGGGGGAGSHHQHHGHFFQESFFFPVQQASLSPTTASCTQDFFFPDVSTVINQEYRPRNDNGHTVLSSTSMSFTDLMMNPLYGIPNKHSKSKEDEEEDIIKTLTHSTPSPPPTASTCITAPPPPPAVPTSLVPPAPTSTIIPLTINDVEGVYISFLLLFLI